MITTGNNMCYSTEKPLGYGFRYNLSVTHIDDLDNLHYTTYGVQMLDEEGNLVAEYLDISTNKSFVERFIELCQKAQVALVHLGDVLEDYLD
ncbi:DUF6514 family protein [Oscillospiraceae bacterium MB08-C2-2]|nr:DUF6514 family protein [Oscillospiraceae bacterium MB08-C2-2]